MEEKKYDIYAARIARKISDIFNNDDDNNISLEEVCEWGRFCALFSCKCCYFMVE